MSLYQMPEWYDGLRLHQNEHTGGCSPRVLEALAALSPGQIASYPPYSAAIAKVAGYLGVAPDRVALTNGLDEGIMAVSMSCLRPAPGGPLPEAVLPEPAFEIFRLDTEVAGGRLVSVMPKPRFAFALDEVLAAITPRTRVVFLTNPNNPTGVPVPLAAVGAIARQVPPEALVFVDEAYAEFSGVSFIPELERFPNVVVGRTFSKAFGLAGLRIGCLVGAPGALDRIRPALPVYSVNAAAVVAVQAAIDDREHLHDYTRQVRESKELMYAACERLGLVCHRSAANFVLVCAGPRAAELVAGVRARGIFIRDRSTEPGCDGCVRIATGIVEHTRRCIAAMEEVLCAAR
ncbi:MAG: histidinol-phosphate aminotransferase family protein [Acidobacteria bacterium]|nr:histidinol-phosphate aminotransferase family protein [Acidobacteriota bacterium]